MLDIILVHTAGLMVLCCTGLTSFGVEPGNSCSMIGGNESGDLSRVRTYCKRLHVTSCTSARLGSLCGGRAVNRGHASSELGVGTSAPERGQVGSELELAFTGGVICMNTTISAFRLSQPATANLRSKPPKLAKFLASKIEH